MSTLAPLRWHLEENDRFFPKMIWLCFFYKWFVDSSLFTWYEPQHWEMLEAWKGKKNNTFSYNLYIWGHCVTHFMSLFSFYTPWKNQKTRGFLMFSDVFRGGYREKPAVWNGLKEDWINSWRSKHQVIPWTNYYFGSLFCKTPTSC